MSRCARATCGHKKSRHNPQSENADADVSCEDCECPEFINPSLVSVPEVCDTCGRGAQYAGTCTSSFHICKACTWYDGQRISTCVGCEQQRISQEAEPEAIPIILTCPFCKARHIDRGEFATKLHHTHACQGCGMVWRPALVPTVGVEFLPGFKNPQEVRVEGLVDGKGVRFLGDARNLDDGSWVALAEVGGALCRVQVNITPAGSDEDACRNTTG